MSLYLIAYLSVGIVLVSLMAWVMPREFNPSPRQRNLLVLVYLGFLTLWPVVLMLGLAVASLVGQAEVRRKIKKWT